MSLYQGFVEARLPDSDLFALKAGRQEFNYGSAFILGPDSFFDGLSFDAVRLRVKPVEPLDRRPPGRRLCHPLLRRRRGEPGGCLCHLDLLRG